MIYISLKTFLHNPERYINEAKNGINIYIYLNDGTELKLEKYLRG